MNMYGNKIISGRSTKLLSLMLITTGIFLLGWNIKVWSTPSIITDHIVRHEKKAAKHSSGTKILSRSAYNRIVNEDPFRASRRAYTAPVKARVVTQTARVAPVLRAPNLVLLGTVILDNGRAAMLSSVGGNSETISYKTGDTIGGFTIKEISEDSVILSRGDEQMYVSMNERAKAPGSAMTERVNPQSWQVRQIQR